MRGRKAESPEVQAAKGHPGKRRTKIEKQIAQANELATLLSAAPSDNGNILAPPSLLNDPRCAGALAVWNEVAPLLVGRNIMTDTDRHALAMYCVYVADFYAAEADIQNRGYSMMVKTVSGDRMPRLNPSVDRRKIAALMILDLAKRFGLTAIDGFNLRAVQRTVLGGAPGALGHVPVNRVTDETDQELKLPLVVPPEAGQTGLLDSFDSPPPDRKH